MRSVQMLAVDCEVGTAVCAINDRGNLPCVGSGRPRHIRDTT